LPMQDIHLRRFRIRYISLCQRLLPTRSLQRICFGEKKKRVSISTRPHQVEGGVDAHVVALVSGFAPSQWRPRIAITTYELDKFE
jgi:Lon protease-like protein